MLGHAVTDRLADDFMRIAEGQTLDDQVIGQIGRGGKTASGGFAHVVGFDLQSRHHVGVGAQTAFDRVDDIEHRLLVFLIVLVVGQRLRLH